MYKCLHQHLNHPNNALTRKTNILSWLLMPLMSTKSFLFRNCQWDHSFSSEVWGYKCLGQAIICPFVQSPLIKEKVWKEWWKNGLGRTLCRNCPGCRQWMFQVDQLSSSDARTLSIPEIRLDLDCDIRPDILGRGLQGLEA